VVSDADEINDGLAPDVVVLDEAQRIKNWQTKTARRVKSLHSRYAFVLTGTPVENRIDELYSIMQYLDPEILGPLFRFNRDFYKLDERGRPVDYRNLTGLRERLQPIVMRRRKADVEEQLPGRTIKNYFVTMADEQRARYEEYSVQAARLIAVAQRRPLTKAEFDRMQMLLACMRMMCDTPAILDPTCRISPKLEELEGFWRMSCRSRAARRSSFPNGSACWRWCAGSPARWDSMPHGTPGRCRRSSGAQRSTGSRTTPPAGCSSRRTAAASA
jgi:SNF2 family DNA or RNA helicase